MLAPTPADFAGSPRKANNLSCVLRVSTRKGAMLLTGDIERAAENALLAQGDRLRADVLLVPHHGSRTSSDPRFVAAVAPAWAIVASGYRNRFAHPNAEIIHRYEAAGANILRTDLDGAIQISLGQGISVSSERSARPRYWR